MHAFFVADEVRCALMPGAQYPVACARCRHVAIPRISIRFESADEGREGYDALLDGEGRPAMATTAEDAV